MTKIRRHTSLNIQGALNNWGSRDMSGIMIDDFGKELSDKEVRMYFDECLKKGWKKIPMCSDEECPDFDHFENGCPGHEISKDEQSNR